LDDKISAFRSQLAHLKGGDLDKLDDRLQALSDEIDGAIQLAKDQDAACGLGQQLQDRVQALRAKIAGSKLSPDFKQDFDKQIAEQLNKINCRAHRQGKQGFMEAKRLAPCKADLSKIEDADDQLKQISDAVDAAVKADGSKSLAELYGPKIDALKKKI